jgi:hypothetical protein
MARAFPAYLNRHKLAGLGFQIREDSIHWPLLRCGGSKPVRSSTTTRLDRLARSTRDLLNTLAAGDGLEIDTSRFESSLPSQPQRSLPGDVLR